MVVTGKSTTMGTTFLLTKTRLENVYATTNFEIWKNEGDIGLTGELLLRGTTFLLRISSSEVRMTFKLELEAQAPMEV